MRLPRISPTGSRRKSFDSRLLLVLIVPNHIAGSHRPKSCWRFGSGSPSSSCFSDWFVSALGSLICSSVLLFAHHLKSASCSTSSCSGMADSGVVKGAGRNKRTWTTEEDAKLVDALMELHASGKYAGADNGFKPGYLQAVQSLLDVSLPNSGLKAEPHIKSRMKTLKTNFSIVHDMLVGTHTSGFGWDPEKCCLTADDEVWDEYIKTHKNAAHFKGKAFPLYDKLSTIFGKDRATGARAVDLGDEDIVGEMHRSEANDVEDSHVGTDVPMSDGVTGSASSKRKRGKSGDFTQIYQDSCMVLNDTFATFGQTLSNDFKSVAKEGTSSVDLMKNVIKELEYLPSITLDERIQAMAVIGNSATYAEMFFALGMSGKVRMVQMISAGKLH